MESPDSSAKQIERLLDRAESLALGYQERENKKLPTLSGRTIVNLFFENSTRTRSSFDLAAKRLSADTVTIQASSSSVEKGESLRDTVQTLSAYGPSAIVVRSPHVGAPGMITRWTDASVINAGDGKHEHPTQALLDAYTLRRRLGELDGRNIWIIGDVLHSRVARSNILCAHGARRDGHGLRTADADPAPDRGARLRGLLHARRLRARPTCSTSCGCRTSA